MKKMIITALLILLTLQGCDNKYTRKSYVPKDASLPMIDTIAKNKQITVLPSASYPLCENNKSKEISVFKYNQPVKYMQSRSIKKDKNGKIMKVKEAYTDTIVGTTVTSNVCNDGDGNTIVNISVKATHLVGFKHFQID